MLEIVLPRATDGDRTVVGVGHRLVLTNLIELWRESFPDLPTSTPLWLPRLLTGASTAQSGPVPDLRLL